MRWLRRLGLSLVGLLVGLLVVELGARLRTPQPGVPLFFNTPDTLPDGLYIPDANLVIVPRPGFNAVVSSVDYAVTVRINAAGLRGPELTPPSAPRWIAVGDSFTMALQVAEEDTFPALLGHRVGLEVWNAGVDGYSTWQALRRYELLDDEVGSGGVLLTFFLGNDLSDNLSDKGRTPLVTDGAPPPSSLTTRRFSRAGELWRWLGTHSAFFAYFRIVEKQALMRQGHDPDGARLAAEMRIFTNSGRSLLNDRLAPSREAFAAFKALTDHRGDRLMVAVAPPYFAADPRETARTLRSFGLDQPALDAPAQAVLVLLTELGIPACDLAPALRAVAEAGDNAYFRYDGHWSPAGHAAAAEAMAGCFTP